MLTSEWRLILVAAPREAGAANIPMKIFQ